MNNLFNAELGHCFENNFHLRLMQELLLKSLSNFNFPEKIAAGDPLFFLGSCFSAEIGERCIREGLRALVNPGGTMFDPMSIQRHLQRIMQPEKFKEEDLFFHQGLFRNWDHYSKLGTADQNETLGLLNSRYELAHDFLKKTKYLFVTFGTAWYYSLKENHRAVCNCHKMPGNIFDKHIISGGQMVKDWNGLLIELKKFNPEIQIVLTVSPVKHLRDGIIGNNRSKSILLDAVHQLIDKQTALYFPSFELVNDVLRDYEYYKADGAHPNEEACDFVFSFFRKKMLE